MGTSQSKATSMLVACAVLSASIQSAHARPSFIAPSSAVPLASSHPAFASSTMLAVRGGDADVEQQADAREAVAESNSDDQDSLDDKVYAAMKRLGLSPPPAAADGASADGASAPDDMDCSDGVCKPKELASAAAVAVNPYELSKQLASEMGVDESLTLAAVSATKRMGETENTYVYDETAARDMIQTELDFIAQISEDNEEVQQLLSEGFDAFMVRRALAYSDNNIEDARAILIAEKEDLEEAKAAPGTVEVKLNFDPTAVDSNAKPPAMPATNNASANKSKDNLPKPADKASVVFEATTEQLQELVLESPVPVLLDIYADWCGPCKVLGPALEDMAVKAGGIFRLVKVNSDNERPVSAALGVTALPTVFGFRDGKIVHMFEGMPRDEKMMQNFMMGLFGAAPFSPPVTAEQTEKYAELTNKLIKTASAASFSFSQRERLVDRIKGKLDDLVQDVTVKDVEQSAKLLRTLFSNILKRPTEEKYRKINLDNAKIKDAIAHHGPALAILKLAGFRKESTNMILGKGKKVVNVAPIVAARDCIDKWIQMNRREMAAAARKHQDELDRQRLQAEAEARGDVEEDDEEEEDVEEVDPNACTLKLRLDGKKKVHEVVLDKNAPLKDILTSLAVDEGAQNDIQVTCVAKRLIIKSTDEGAMDKSLAEHGLFPSAALVVKVVVADGKDAASASSSIKDRAAKRKLKKGSHTMQSIGIYAKDDNNKAELIDGGGGVWYEHDISDDEEDDKADGDADAGEASGTSESAAAEADADVEEEQGDGEDGETSE